MFVFESQSQKLAPIKTFLWRIFFTFCIGVALILATLVAGIIGFHKLANFDYIDSFLNASEILAGMGQATAIDDKYSNGKIFAGLYSIFCGVNFTIIITLLYAPIFHRLLHRFKRVVVQDMSEEEITKKAETAFIKRLDKNGDGIIDLYQREDEAPSCALCKGQSSQQ